ncbi:MAG TPA: hypothetical protein VKU01_22390 [Bryobacteraceae bacterium]|nr:hypothetical protein [Bryobacteraceae bacterium]
MHRALTVVTVVFCLAACTSKPSAPVARARNHFAGTVGQLDDGSEFVQFIDNHENQAVTLDIRLPSVSFDGGQEKELDFFVVWDSCDNLPEGQKPNYIHCTGFEYNIPKAAGGASPLIKRGNDWSLRGRFKVVNAGGPLQGLMAVRLEPQ